MKNLLEGYELEIEYIYASLLTIIFFTLLFGSCIPILYPLTFLALLVQFWCYKFIFIRFCKKPLVYNHSMSRKASNMLFFGLIMHCIACPIFFKSPQIYPQFQSNQHQSFFDRIFSMWYYFVLLLLIVAYLTIRNPILSLAKKLSEKKEKQMEIKQKECQKQCASEEGIFENGKSRRKHSLPTMIRAIQNQADHHPYSMHENKLYGQILKILYTINNRERTRKTMVLHKQLYEMYENKSNK